MKLRSYTYKMTIFLSVHTDRFGCGAARSLFLTVWTPNIGTQVFGHLLDTLLTFVPNCRQFVYVEPSTPKILVHIPLLIEWQITLLSEAPSTHSTAAIFKIK